MALATPDRVIEMGALDYTLFNLTSKRELVDLVQRWIDVNDLHIQTKAGSNYTSSDALVIANLTMGEVFLTLADLIGQLAARKVYGTHYPIDSEDSSSYLGDPGLESFYRQRAEEFLSDYFVLDEPGTSVVLPVFMVSTDVDPRTEQTSVDDLTEWLDEASGFTRQKPAPAVVQ